MYIERMAAFRRVSRGAFEIRSRPRETVHAVVRRTRGEYVGECLEIAVVSQGRTLDELVDGLREAVELHLEGEDTAALGLAPALRLAVTYELPARTR